MTPWKDTVRQRFDAAAGTYDRSAGVQLRVAAALARTVLGLPLPAAPVVLEVGCGTGYLTALLGGRLAWGRWLATDLSPAMIQACARRAGPGVDLGILDGERPELPGRFDLVVSSLAAQWFADPAAGLARQRRLLRPGGLLAAATLGPGTFPEWRRLCAQAGVQPGLPDYPDAAGLARALGPGCRVGRREYRLRCADLRAFLEHLRRTGARTAAPGRPAMAAGILARLLRAGTGAPFTATFEVLTVVAGRER